MNKKITLISFLLIFLVSCASPAAPEPTVTPVPSSTQTATITPTTTPEPSPTVTPTATIVIPDNVADYTPENTPATFEHQGHIWTMAQNDEGKDVWRALNPDGTLVAGMEHVSMEHVEAYYDRVEMFGMVYDLGKVKIVVTPDYPAFYDFTKSGNTIEALGSELWRKLRSDVRDPKIIQALDGGAPITVFLGSRDKADRLPYTSSSANPMRQILSEDGRQVLGELVCIYGEGNGIYNGPIVDADGKVLIGVFYVGERFDALAETQSTSVDVMSEINSPFVMLGVAMRRINLVENYAAYKADENPADVVNDYAAWVRDNAEIEWIE